MATTTTSTTAAVWRPDINTFAPVDIVPEALYVSSANRAGVIEGDAPVVRVAYIADDEAQFTPEGDEIPEADPVMSEALVHTHKITELARFSREQYNQVGTAAQVSQSFKRSITKRANLAFISQLAPVAPAVAPAAGLLHITGTVTGDEVDASLDALVDLIAELQTNGATPTHMVLAPTSWAALRKLKTGTASNQSLIGAGVQDAALTLLGLPVIVSPAVPNLSGVVIDQNEVSAAYGDIQTAVSTDAYFTSDSVAVRATWRVGHVVPRPNRIGTFTVAE